MTVRPPLSMSGALSQRWSEPATVVNPVRALLEEVSEASSPDSIPAWDSLQHLMLVVGLEQEFAVEFSPEEVEELATVELIAELLVEKQESRAA